MPLEPLFGSGLPQGFLGIFLGLVLLSSADTYHPYLHHRRDSNTPYATHRSGVLIPSVSHARTIIIGIAASGGFRRRSRKRSPQAPYLYHRLPEGRAAAAIAPRSAIQVPTRRAVTSLRGWPQAFGEGTSTRLCTTLTFWHPWLGLGPSAGAEARLSRGEQS
jgi:hypothetical protein